MRSFGERQDGNSEANSRGRCRSHRKEWSEHVETSKGIIAKGVLLPVSCAGSRQHSVSELAAASTNREAYQQPEESEEDDRPTDTVLPRCTYSGESTSGDCKNCSEVCYV